MNETPQTELCVRFDAETIAAYCGAGVGSHSDADVAAEAGFDGLVSWGTLTMLPFWELIGQVESLRGPHGFKLDVQFTKPVIAGDSVRYSMQQSFDPDGRSLIELTAVTDRHGTVATAIARTLDPGLA